MLSILLTLAIAIVAEATNVNAKAKPYAQDNEEQFQLLRFTGTTGPYITHRGYGISTEVPFQCQVTQAHLVMRHGERYPTTGTGKAQKNIYQKLKNATIDNYTGPLAFVEDWEFFVPDSDRLETESDKGFYSGLGTSYTLGAEWRSQYAHLFDGETVHPVFAGGQERVIESARAFAKGFFAANYTQLASIQIIPEVETQGANTLTTHDACVNYNSTEADELIASFPTDYLEKAAARLNKLSPGYDLDSGDIYNLLGYCGFELNVVGTSPVCDIFTTEELVTFSYTKSLTYYYENGPGYNLSTALGSVLVNNTYTLLSQGSEYPYNLTFSFTHDSDLFTYTTALGLFVPDYDLSLTEVEHESVFRAGEIAPMGGRVVTERLECVDILTNATDVFARVIVNDAVIPIPSCQSGPGFSCPIEEYKEVLEDRLNGTTYIEACGVNASYPQYTTFYWDWDVTFEDN